MKLDNSERTLLRQTELYLLANPVSRKHAANIRSRMRRFAEWMGGDPLIDTLSAEDVNGFLVSLTESGLSPHTANGYRAALLAIWAFAIDDRPPGKIRRVRPPATPPEGWRIEEVRQLLRVARHYRGHLPNGVSRKTFWLTAIHVGWCTGLRYGDVASLRVDAIRAGGIATVVQSKTGKPCNVRFSEAALELIREHGQELVLPNPYTQKWFCEKFALLVEQSGVRPGSFKWLRRSSGSYTDRKDGRGPELLGNTRQIFDRNYRVNEICDREPPEPPRL